MGKVFVKAHRRGRSVVKAYYKTLTRMSQGNSFRLERREDSLYRSIKKKIEAGRGLSPRRASSTFAHSSIGRKADSLTR